MRNKAPSSVLVLICLFLCNAVACAKTAIPVIHPTPKHIELKSNTSVALSDNWVIVTDRQDGGSRFNAEYLKRQLQVEFGLNLEVVEPAAGQALSGRRIVLAVASTGDWWNGYLGKLPVPDTAGLGKEGYRI